MNYKYLTGDLVKLKLPKLAYQEDLCEVVNYNPTHPNPDNILTLKLQNDDIIIFTLDSSDGPNGIKEEFKIKMRPIYCNPSDVTPVDPKGVIIAPQIDSNGIYYQVRVNGYRKLKLVLEAKLKPVGEKLKELL